MALMWSCRGGEDVLICWPLLFPASQNLWRVSRGGARNRHPCRGPGGHPPPSSARTPPSWIQQQIWLLQAAQSSAVPACWVILVSKSLQGLLVSWSSLILVLTTWLILIISTFSPFISPRTFPTSWVRFFLNSTSFCWPVSCLCSGLNYPMSICRRYRPLGVRNLHRNALGQAHTSQHKQTTSILQNS